MPAKTPNRFQRVTRATTTTLLFGGALRHGNPKHNFFIDLDGNITTLNATGMRDGDEVCVILKQNSAGGHTVGWGNMWQFAADEPTVTSTANVASIVQGIYCAAIGKIIAVYDTGAAISASISLSASPSSSSSASASASTSPSASVSLSPSPSSSSSSSSSASVSRSSSASISPSASASPSSSSSSSSSASVSPSSSASPSA